jgi:hypothetical protein
MLMTTIPKLGVGQAQIVTQIVAPATISDSRVPSTGARLCAILAKFQFRPGQALLRKTSTSVSRDGAHRSVLRDCLHDDAHRCRAYFSASRTVTLRFRVVRATQLGGIRLCDLLMDQLFDSH